MMKGTLKKLGLVKTAQFRLEVPHDIFTERLQLQLDPYRFRPLEAFSSGKRFRGKVIDNKLMMRPRRKLFGNKFSYLKIEGEISSEGIQTQVELTIVTWNLYLTAVYLAIFLFYLIVIIKLVQSNLLILSQSGIIISIVLLLHFVLMVSSPILLMKKSVDNLLGSLEGYFLEIAKIKVKT